MVDELSWGISFFFFFFFWLWWNQRGTVSCQRVHRRGFGEWAGWREGAPLQPAATPLCSEVEWCLAAVGWRRCTQHAPSVECGRAGGTAVCGHVRWGRFVLRIVFKKTGCGGQMLWVERAWFWQAAGYCASDELVPVCVWTRLNVKQPWKDWVSQERQTETE